MVGKKGAAGEWIIVIVLMLIVGGISVYISYTFVSNAKAEIKAEGYSKCELVELTNGPKDGSYKSEYASKTPRQICTAMSKQVKFVSARHEYDIYYGILDNTNDECNPDSPDVNLALGLSDFFISGDTIFDTVLLDDPTGAACRSSGRTTYTGHERTIYTSALCC